MLSEASAAVLAFQLDWLITPVDVDSTPSHTLMVTVTVPTPGETMVAAEPVAVVQLEVELELVGAAVAVAVAVGAVVADWVGAAVDEAVGAADPLGDSTAGAAAVPALLPGVGGVARGTGVPGLTLCVGLVR